MIELKKDYLQYLKRTFFIFLSIYMGILFIEFSIPYLLKFEENVLPILAKPYIAHGLFVFQGIFLFFSMLMLCVSFSIIKTNTKKLFKKARFSINFLFCSLVLDVFLTISGFINFVVVDQEMESIFSYIMLVFFFLVFIKLLFLILIMQIADEKEKATNKEVTKND